MDQVPQPVPEPQQNLPQESAVPQSSLFTSRNVVVVASIFILVLIFIGLGYVYSSRDLESTSVTDEELTKTYANGRFGYAIRYPDLWEIVHKPQNADGIGFDTGDPDVEVVVWGSYFQPEFADIVFADVKEKGFSSRKFKLDGSDIATLIEGTENDIHKLKVVLIKNGIQYGFQASFSAQSYEQREILMKVARSLTTYNQIFELPTEVGKCSTTAVAEIGYRLYHPGADQNLVPVVGSGSSVTYTNGLFQYWYEQISGVDQSQIGDPVLLCLVSISANCPLGDDYGRVYSATNLRTGESWQAVDGLRKCVGA